MLYLRLVIPNASLAFIREIIGTSLFEHLDAQKIVSDVTLIKCNLQDSNLKFDINHINTNLLSALSANQVLLPL
ncbi:hypothetical protein EAE89_10165 [Photorhabdus heterorhabditis]|uniref:Uncharacterized protein n=1 Tax=Photorhabdus heterorhabditis TaxID=880156 RepID=A0ABR5KED5_9GAMM|nr:hypothetical protein AM629_06560 [Photorhabdus heterorhabditis]MBS9442057.1 hypothetical protein [Photorhabdus heterorhabditis]